MHVVSTIKMSNVCNSFTSPMFNMITFDISNAVSRAYTHTNTNETRIQHRMASTTGDHILKKLILIYRNFHAKCTHSNDDDDGTIEISQTFRFSQRNHLATHIQRYDCVRASGYHGVKRHTTWIILYTWQVNTEHTVYVSLNHMSSFIPMFDSISLTHTHTLYPLSSAALECCRNNRNKSKTYRQRDKSVRRRRKNVKMWRKFSLIFSASIEKRLLFIRIATTKPSIFVSHLDSETLSLILFLLLFLCCLR